jgi:YebC/PmpR family DNA-binding regulatory protein
MAGHSKWEQIKRAKGATDAARSKLFSKFGRLLATESKRVKGDVNAPSLRAIIEKAKKENMSKDTIERAIKKGLGGEAGSMEAITYEGYGPGGAALIIEALTDNRNKAAQEVKHILSKNGGSLGAIGSATWAFTKAQGTWTPNLSVPLNEADSATLITIMEELEDNDEVQEVFTNAEFNT